MKTKLLSLLVLVAGILFATSCADLALTPNPVGGDVPVSFSVAYQSDLGVKTRAISDGNTVNQLTYAVYDAQGVLLNVADPQTGVKTVSVGDELDNGVQKEVTFTLTKGQTYKIVFWAQAAECAAYSFNGQNGNISIDLDQLKNNQESADAFYKCLTYTVDEQESVPVVMQRPFAQLNVGVTEADWAAAVASGVTVEKSQVTLNNVANTLNLLTGAVSGDVSHTFELNVIPSSQEELELKDGSTYRYLSSTYFLVNDGSVSGDTRATLNSAAFVFTTADGKTVNLNSGLNNIPVQRNWRTNIVGQILTGDIKFNVNIDKGYAGDVVNPITATDVAAANEAFAGGATYVEIESVTNPDETIILPDTEEGVSISLPTTTSDITVEYTPNGDSPASLNINVPSGDISNITFNIPNTTVYINGEFVDVTALTASNTLYVTAGSEISGTLTVAKGNVVIEKGATVAKVVRSNDNPDQVTTVTVYDVNGIPEINDSKITLVLKDIDVIEVTTADEFVNAVSALNKADIKLLNDIEIDANTTVLVNKGKEIVVDLNGNTLSSTNTRNATFNEFFLVKGTLTLNNGTVTYEHTGENLGWAAGVGVVDITDGGVLNLDEVTLQNLGGSDMNFAIHMNNWGSVTANIANSVVEATYIPIRVFNSGYDMNNLTITSSTIESTAGNRALWVHNFTPADFGANYDQAAVEGRLNFNILNNGNSFIVNKPEVNRIFEYGFTNAINLDLNGNYVARNEFALNYAISKLSEGTIKIGADFTLTNTVVIPSDKNITLDLNGFTISEEKTCTESYSMFSNSGDLTITGNGTISFKDLGAGGGQTWGTYNIVNYGTLSVLNGTIEHLGSTTLGDTNYPIQNYQGTVNVLGGKINSPNSRSVRDFTAGGTINISGGEFIGQVWMQGLGTGSSTLNISGGNFSPAGLDGSSVFVTNGTNDILVYITGGTFNTKIGCTQATKDGIAGSITGGTFTEAAKENTKVELLAAGYSFVADGNGMYTVQK